MKFRELVVVFSLLAMLGCSGRHDGLECPTVVVYPSSRDVIRMSDFVERVEYIPLEKTDECLIREVSRVFELDNELIVVDKKDKSIFFFDRSGHYRRKISKRGRAGNEYVSMDAVMLDAVRRQLIVFDLMSKKLLFYSLDGVCEKVVPRFGVFEDRYIRDMINLSDGNFLCYSYLHGANQNYGTDGVWEVSADGEFVRWIQEFDLIHPAATVDYAFFHREDGTVGWMCVEYTKDYYYDEAKARPLLAYEVDGPTAKDFSGMNNNDYAFRWAKGEMFNDRRYTQYRGDCVFTCWGSEVENHRYYSLYDKRTGRCRVGELDYAFGDTELLPSGFNRFSKEPVLNVVDTNMAKVLVAPVYPAMLLNNEKSCRILDAVLDRLGIGGSEEIVAELNPVLQLMYLK